MPFFTYFKKRNKTVGFTVLCISILFKFEISYLCESFFKFNANLVMFTTINIYETILNKYYVHHTLKICIYTGMTATTKFARCHTRQHLKLPVVTSSLHFTLYIIILLYLLKEELCSENVL